MREAEIERNGGQYFTQEQLSEYTGLSLNTLARILKQEQAVDKRTLVRFLQAFGSQLLKEDYTQSVLSPQNLEVRQPNQRQDWGEAADVSVFYGREAELLQLKQWVVQDRCRLIALLGIGGIGKSALAVKLAQEIQSEFEVVVWRSLQNAPSLEELLTSVLQVLLRVSGEDMMMPTNLTGKLSKLMEGLRSSRCLLILDNAETILSSGSQVGQYRTGYEGYGQLLRCIGESLHESCVMLTSREQPREITLLDGKKSRVRSLQLQGLRPNEVQHLFQHKGDFIGQDAEWKMLIEHYQGNPLALKLVAAATLEIFNGKIAEVLHYVKQGILVFDDTRDLLKRQCERLSAIEQEVMLWLAINRGPMSISELAQEIVTVVSKQKLPEALTSLLRRSLIEKSAERFSLQPVVMEYFTERLVEQACEEINKCDLENAELLESSSTHVLQNYALMQATAKDYVRETQKRLIVQPLIERLLAQLSSQPVVERQLKQLLEHQRLLHPQQPGYVGGNILNLLGYLQVDLRGYDFSKICVWQADLRQLNLAGVNFQNANLAKSVFAETLTGVVAVAFNPDGKLLATGEVDGKVRLWQVADGKQLLTFEGHTGWVWAVNFSPDCRTLVSGSHDQSIRLWDVVSGNCLQVLHGHTSGVRSVSFNLDGQTLASGSHDSSIRLWDVVSGNCLQVLQGHTNGVYSVSFSPDGQMLASGSNDSSIKLWDIATGKHLQVLLGHTSGVRSVSFSPDGQMLASGSNDSCVRLWDIAAGQCLQLLQGHASAVWSINFSPDGQTVASGSNDSSVRIWDVQGGRCLQVLQGHSTGVWSVNFSPDRRTLASCSNDATVRLWDVQDGQCFQVLQGLTSGILSVSFNSNGRILASCSNDTMVRLWDVQDGHCLQVLQGHTSATWAATFSPDGQTLASCSHDSLIWLWNVHSGKCFQVLYGHTDWVRSISFSPDGQILASGSNDSSVRLWDMRDGQCLKVLHGNKDWVRSVSFSPDGQILASGSFDSSVRLWDMRDGQCLKVLHGHSSGICSVSFSPDGQILASGSDDRTIRLWNVSDGHCLKVLHGHTSGVYSVSLSQTMPGSLDSCTLASGSHDQTVRLWDAHSGQCLKVLHGHTNKVWSVNFSPAGLIIASGSQDETIKLWDVSMGKCVNTLRAERLYEDMNITGIISLTEAQKTTLKTLGAIEIKSFGKE
jgi:WD40 repeat protein/transcriptional regulator with XRE-family HTH domain/DNA-binding transcriptional regulator GbsR (MarR family)